MNELRKLMGAINTAFFAVLNFVFFVRPGSQPVDWPGDDAAVGTPAGPNTGLYGKGFLYMTHEDRGKTIQADREDRRRRGHDQYHGYNW